MRNVPCVLLVVVLGACANEVTTPECASNADCAAGSVCLSGACGKICRADRDCDAGQACLDGTCAVCQGCRSAPEVDALDGLGSVDGAASHGAHHVTGALALIGRNLQGVSVSLAGPGQAPQTLEVCGVATSERIEVQLPTGLVPETYTLTVTNQAGACQTSATFLQGEAGPAGTYVVGAGLLLNGDDLSVDFGAANTQVAAGDHTHGDLLSLAGGQLSGTLSLLDPARLGVGTTTPAGRFDVRGDAAARTLNNPSGAMVTNSGFTLNSGIDAVVDGNTVAVAWHSDASPSGSWLSIDLGAGGGRDYVEVGVFANTVGYAGVYDVQFSDNGSAWTTAIGNLRPALAGWNNLAWTNVGVHRYWRLLLTNTPGGGPWLNELALYEATAGSGLLVTPEGRVGINTATPQATLDVVGSARIGGRTIARVTSCEYGDMTTGKTVTSPAASQFYYAWRAADCDNGLPRGSCVGFLSKGVHSGGDEDWRVLSPSDTPNIAPGALVHGGMEWWCSACANHSLRVGAVYLCDQ